MIVYIKPRPILPSEFKHTKNMKPVPLSFDSVDDRVSPNTFVCMGQYDSVWITTLLVGSWNEVDISFAEDMRIVTNGNFYLKSINSEDRTLMGTIKFYDMANAIEVEKLTREHESMKNINCLCTTAIARRPMVRYNEYNIGTVDKGTRSLRAISELKVEKIITNGPATIVFWNDGTKTVVKCDIHDKDDLYDAVANALAKKVFGSTSKFHRIIDKNIVRTRKDGLNDHLCQTESRGSRFL